MQITDSSRSRSNFRQKITKFVRKAKALINRINNLKQNEHEISRKRKYLKSNQSQYGEDSEEHQSDEDEDYEDYEETENTEHELDTDEGESTNSETSNSNEFESSENEASETELGHKKGKSLKSVGIYMDYEKFQKGIFPWLPASASNLL